MTIAQERGIQKEHIITGQGQGTTYTLKYFSDKEINKKSIDSILSVIDLSMSLYKDSSLINRFNEGPDLYIDMDPHMKKVIKESFKIHKFSKGYFDITVFPLVSLWGFGPKGFSKVPNQNEVDSVKQFVGMDKLYVRRNRLYKTDPRVRIDLNGIAQGYTVDCLAAYLSHEGVKNFLVELGGEIRTKGQKPNGNFQIMIDEKATDTAYSYPVLSVKNMAVTSSGVREKHYRLGDKIVSHHIDPRSGKPIESKTISVTVIAKTALLADAVDNYFMSLDVQEAIRIAEKTRDVDICLYYLDNKNTKVTYTSGFNNYIYK